MHARSDPITNSNKSCVPKGKPTTIITQGIGIGHIILQFVITYRCDLCESVSISFMFLRSREGVSLTHLFSAHGNSYLSWAWKRGQGSPDHFRKVAFALEPETGLEAIWMTKSRCSMEPLQGYSSHGKPQTFKIWQTSNIQKYGTHPFKDNRNMPIIPLALCKKKRIRKCFGVPLAGQKKVHLETNQCLGI